VSTGRRRRTGKQTLTEPLILRAIPYLVKTALPAVLPDAATTMFSVVSRKQMLMQDSGATVGSV
jgi:hypothetical protein